MNKMYPILLSALLLGCTTSETISTVAPVHSIQITDFSSVDWYQLDVPASVDFEVSKQSQFLINDVVSSPVAAFELPGNRGSLDIDVSTLVQDEKDLFAVNILVLDSTEKVLYEKSFSDFEYKHAKYLDPDKFVATLTVVPDGKQQPLRVLLYTTASDLQTTSTVTHPAKLFAIAKNTVPPQIDDPKVQHSLKGLLRLSVSANDLVTKRVREEVSYVPQSLDSSDFYKSQIEIAVKEGDLPKALSLLEEAKALNVEGAQQVFIKAVNAK